MTLVRDWIVFTFLRLINWLGWPTWLLVLIGLLVVPIAYCLWVARTLRASE